MSKKLSPRTLELLEILQEEAAEVIQAVSKIKRFGTHSFHPDDPLRITNIEHLGIELGDTVGMIDLLISSELSEIGLNWDTIGKNGTAKKEKIKRFLQTEE